MIILIGPGRRNVGLIVIPIDLRHGGRSPGVIRVGPGLRDRRLMVILTSLLILIRRGRVRHAVRRVVAILRMRRRARHRVVVRARVLAQRLSRPAEQEERRDQHPGQAVEERAVHDSGVERVDLPAWGEDRRSIILQQSGNHRRSRKGFPHAGRRNPGAARIFVRNNATLAARRIHRSRARIAASCTGSMHAALRSGPRRRPAGRSPARTRIRVNRGPCGRDGVAAAAPMPRLCLGWILTALRTCATRQVLHGRGLRMTAYQRHFLDFGISSSRCRARSGGRAPRSRRPGRGAGAAARRSR